MDSEIMRASKVRFETCGFCKRVKGYKKYKLIKKPKNLYSIPSLKWKRIGKEYVICYRCHTRLINLGTVLELVEILKKENEENGKDNYLC